jgi:acetylornithine aminotransferase
VVCAAALAVLDTIESAGLLERAVRLGSRLADGIRAAAAGGRDNGPDSGVIRGVRGRGLWLAIELAAPVAAAFEAAAREAGFLVNAPIPDAVRLAPPLVVTAADADAFLAVLPRLAAVASAAAASKVGP